MRIIVDENIPRRTVDALRAMGHQVSDIRGTDDEGCDDDILWRRAQDEQALVVTTDKGFLLKSGLAHWGVLAVCLRQPNSLKIHARVLQAFGQFTEVEWRGLSVAMRDTVQSVRGTGEPAEIPEDAA